MIAFICGVVVGLLAILTNEWVESILDERASRELEDAVLTNHIQPLPAEWLDRYGIDWWKDTDDPETQLPLYDLKPRLRH